MFVFVAHEAYSIHKECVAVFIELFKNTDDSGFNFEILADISVLKGKYTNRLPNLSKIGRDYLLKLRHLPISQN